MNHRTYDRIVTALPSLGRGISAGEVSRATGIGYKTVVKYLRQSVTDEVVESARYEYRAGIASTLYVRITDHRELSREEEVASALEASVNRWTGSVHIKVTWCAVSGMFRTECQGYIDWHYSVASVVYECADALNVWSGK